MEKYVKIVSIKRPTLWYKDDIGKIFKCTNKYSTLERNMSSVENWYTIEGGRKSILEDDFILSTEKAYYRQQSKPEKFYADNYFVSKKGDIISVGSKVVWDWTDAGGKDYFTISKIYYDNKDRLVFDTKESVSQGFVIDMIDDIRLYKEPIKKEEMRDSFEEQMAKQEQALALYGISESKTRVSPKKSEISYADYQKSLEKLVKISNFDENKMSSSMNEVSSTLSIIRPKSRKVRYESKILVLR